MKLPAHRVPQFGTLRGPRRRAVARFPGSSAWDEVAGASRNDATSREEGRTRTGEEPFRTACATPAARDLPHRKKDAVGEGTRGLQGKLREFVAKARKWPKRRRTPVSTNCHRAPIAGCQKATTTVAASDTAAALNVAALSQVAAVSHVEPELDTCRPASRGTVRAAAKLQPTPFARHSLPRPIDRDDRATLRGR